MKETIEGYEPFEASHGNGDPRAYPMFGYESVTINAIMVKDDAPAIKKAFEYGWIDANSETIDQLTMTQYANKRGATKCAEALAELGCR